MALTTQPYKGTRDFYPEDQRIQKWMFGKMRRVVESYGYAEYDGPMLEPFELYAAKSGEELVNQQLYSLVDRGERKMAIRPEMTPTMARMVAGKIHELPRPVRWYSIPNVWRYERPQRGRLREHWQLNVDVLGGDPLLADAEILLLSLDIVRAFGGEKHVAIKINNRHLMDHLFVNELKFTPEAALAVTKAIDARAKIGEEAYEKWLGELGVTGEQKTRLENFFKMPFEQVARELPCAGARDLSALFGYLRESGVESQIVYDPTVLRGLDYYTGTVFEMYDVSPDNRRAMFGGGRYDNLVGLFGKEKLAGVGLGFGDVTLRNFLETHSLLPKFESEIDVFVSLPSLAQRKIAEDIARELRSLGLSAMTPLSADGFGAQLKLASKHGAKFAVLMGDRELAEGKVLLKDMATGTQDAVAIKDAAQTVAARSLSKKA